MEKRAAMELSISTIVVFVIAVLMLIIGVVLVGQIGCSAITGVKELDERMKQNIIDSFRDTNERVVFKERINEVSKGVEYGIGFAIKNTEGGERDFTYELSVRDTGACTFSNEEAESWITLGKTDSFRLDGGREYVSNFAILIPSNIENCRYRYVMEIRMGGQVYEQANVDVEIINKPLTRSFC